MAAPAAPRLLQIDGLRAIAALLVVAYHYTYGFEERFHHVIPLGVTLPFGYLGVYLFFAISGFVIFMTLDRCQQPMDFVVSRFARLFPTYWAAVAITFITMQLFTIPNYDITWPQALANLLMVHAFFGVPDVDGVYWSLQIELLFYFWMLAIWSLGLLRHSLVLSFAWVGAGLAYGIVHHVLGVGIPATLGEAERTLAAVLSAALVLLASRGFLPWLAIALAIGVSIAIATALHYLVEDPSRRGIRDAYARGKASRRATPEANAVSSPSRATALAWFPRCAVGSCATIVLFAGGNVIAGRLNAARAGPVVRRAELSVQVHRLGSGTTRMAPASLR